MEICTQRTSSLGFRVRLRDGKDHVQELFTINRQDVLFAVFQKQPDSRRLSHVLLDHQNSHIAHAISIQVPMREVY